ncbi:MAG: ATP-binding protein [Eubacterium sp.]
MKELSLHILDITQNSIRAGATLVELCIVEDTLEDLLSITISDDGCGIPKDRLADITNPFVTSRTTRKVGLGLPLFKAAAEGCDGWFTIRSEEG